MLDALTYKLASLGLWKKPVPTKTADEVLELWKSRFESFLARRDKVAITAASQLLLQSNTGSVLPVDEAVLFIRSAVQDILRESLVSLKDSCTAFDVFPEVEKIEKILQQLIGEFLDAAIEQIMSSYQYRCYQVKSVSPTAVMLPAPDEELSSIPDK